MANYPYNHPASQWGPPPFSGQQNHQPQWAPPSGPPPQQWQPPQAPPPGFNGGWQPPTGAPPITNDHTRPYPGHYGHGNPPTSYQQAYNQGPPGAHYQPPQPQTTRGEPYFQYSKCTGRRKALCIGINYVGQTGELRGCHNDALNMQKFLIERYNYKQEDMVILLDTPGANPRQIPTRANIISAMQWLVSNAQPNDSLFSGHIVDDDMFAIMVAPLPPGCRLTGIFDVEFPILFVSATTRPNVYSTEGKIKEPNLLAEAGQGALQAGLSYMRGDLGGVAKGLMGLGKKVISGNKADKISKATRTSPADAIQWSGCKDSQTSADAVEAGSATGSMSYAFITSLTQAPQQTYQQLLVSIRQILANKYSQKPQLSASHPIDTNLMFVM
ncbi:uncharacterized protein PGTG_04570 [Puccinia graminis f. sp. tritici CRL 75-36-700-3]|uniref:Peptidase C14 caspase domain-containing protein n=1 Tax=Puccinia graminis f. sp. tritici (strain CRL 75-36-700-3 / race SCCL) TaxID=418459 RepID=E3K2P5_PUCGT|nr:uncharacterized protein PGTG_04570 [Puccinia graminis f. sp. tritici CRL 75-36-700-3]EFP78614.2 hypothetical protein PGTG_04570 [Puccinia graminis f. sp. tritici CRL 75-36-700-3]